MSAIDDLLAANADYDADVDPAGLPVPPGRSVTIVTCMDARIDVYGLLGLSLGDAHVLRNAGGVVTDDVVRSLLISQRLLGTREIMLIHHTDCGMTTFSDDQLRAELEAEIGLRPAFALEAFPEIDGDVRQSLARLRANPFVNADAARGFVYDVASTRLREVI